MNIFVIGAHRSGTTAMLEALSHATRLPSHAEGHVFRLVGTFERSWVAARDSLPTTEDSSTFSLLRVDGRRLRLGLVRVVAEELGRLHQSESWIDKSPGPEMLASLNDVAAGLPAAKFVFMHRHPVACLRSLMARFPRVDLRTHVRGWCESNRAWLAIRESLAERSLELSQNDLQDAPEDAARRLARFLALPEEQCESLRDFLAERRPEQGQLRARPGRLDIASLSNDPSDWEFVESNCRDIAETFGYTLPPTSAAPEYEKRSKRVHLFFPIENDPRGAEARDINQYCYRLHSDEFTLTANQKHTPAPTLLYHGITLERGGRLVGRVRREFSNGPLLQLSVALSNDDGKAIYCQEVALEGGEWHELDEKLPPCEDATLALSLELAPAEASEHYSTTVFQNVHLTSG